MIVHTKIIGETENSTLSEVYINGEFFGYNLEDGFNEPKIPGETRIAHGVYPVLTRQAGKHYYRYNNKWAHKYSFWIRFVTNFNYIMWHIGNSIDDTLGCPLIGSDYKKDSSGDYYVTASTVKYKALYKKLSAQFDAGGTVVIAVDRSNSKYEVNEAINLNKIIND